ncbi:MAG: hypothetical protein JWM10_2483 [Myxococcaceae bacterium]|nr:hypothetical protein [Myxococcaceae bacterium]
MREQLLALEELAKSDLAWRQIDVELADVDAHLVATRSDVDRIRDLLERERQQLTEAQRLKQTHVDEIATIDEKSIRSKKRQEVARNNREMEAMNREIEVLKREREERTAEAARLEEVVVAVGTQLKAHEADFKGLTDMLATEESEAVQSREALLARKALHQGARKELTGKVRPEILRIYQIVLNRRGTAVAECKDGICRGCYMATPPQLYNVMLRAEKLIQCPNCQRILLPPNLSR